MTASERGFAALVATQALSAFNTNMLRAALLTLAAFRPLDTGGLSRETVVALSTLFIVAPYVVLSLPAGRLADRLPKARLLQTVKTIEIGVFLIAAAGLSTGNLTLLLAAILLAGICAASFGPAKFGIIPELLPVSALVRGNAWISASSTLAILGGLITGNLLALSPTGLQATQLTLVGIAVIGWLTSLAIPATPAPLPLLSLSPRAFSADFLDSVARLRTLPAIVLPVLGCSWFWFQGALTTSLIPLYVADTQTLPESAVSLLLIATSLGVTVGAIAAHLLSQRRVPAPAWLGGIALAITALPGLDLWLAGTIAGKAGLWRALADIALVSAGCGLFVVPLGTAVQQLTPAGERARFVGINHTFNGLAMVLAGAGLLLLNAPMVSPSALFAASAIISGGVAALTMIKTWPALLLARKGTGQ